MADRFSTHEPQLDSPADRGFSITPDNDDDLALNTRMIYVGGAGDITVIMAGETNDANTLLFKAVPVGTVLPIRVRRVLATGTTATLLLGLL